MKVIVRESVYEDLRETVLFYEAQEKGVGQAYLACMFGEIDQLANFAGTHGRSGKFYRAIVQKHHTAIFYILTEDLLDIRRVIDLRRHPKWIRHELKRSQ
jgi:plasmid stabilization system protein ParE